MSRGLALFFSLPKNQVMHILSLLTLHLAFACTNIRVTEKIDGESVDMIGRSMEFMSQFPVYDEWSVSTHPRGESMGSGIECSFGHSATWSNKYGFVSIDNHLSLGSIGDPKILQVISEGLNEHGLGISMQIFHAAEYQPRHSSGNKTLVAFSCLVQFLLGNFETVKSVRHALEKSITVYDPFPHEFRVMNCHWGIEDAQGGHGLIEYIDGKLHFHNNDLGVFTNDPRYEWHAENLNQYVSVSPEYSFVSPQVSVKTEDFGTLPMAVGHGQNTLRLPGDFTAAGRFVRVFYLRQLSTSNSRPTTKASCFHLVSSLLDSVMIPLGANARRKPETGFESTEWTTIKIPKYREFYFRSYTGTQWKVVKLDEIDFDADSPKVIPMTTGSDILDVTPRLQNIEVFAEI